MLYSEGLSTPLVFKTLKLDQVSDKKGHNSDLFTPILLPYDNDTT